MLEHFVNNAYGTLQHNVDIVNTLLMRGCVLTVFLLFIIYNENVKESSHYLFHTQRTHTVFLQLLVPFIRSLEL